MKDVSATEASRRFSEMLDAVEHGNESFRIVRAGRPVARITPIARANGAEVVEVLRSYSADPVWADDLQSLRSLLNDEERHWPG